MEKSGSRHSSELLKLENLDATSDRHLAKLLSVKNKKSDGNFETHKFNSSSVLDRVKLFLPDMKQANKELETRIENGSASDVDIENVDDSGENVIEMSVAVVQYDESSSDCDSGEDYASEGEDEDSGDDVTFRGPMTAKATTQVLIRPAT